MCSVIATKDNEKIQLNYGAYHIALTMAVKLQNKGYTVKIERD